MDCVSILGRVHSQSNNCFLFVITAEASIFTNREFSFTVAGDVYIRYLSYENQSEFEKDICTRNPDKIDIGAVMSVR